MHPNEKYAPSEWNVFSFYGLFLGEPNLNYRKTSHIEK